MVNATGASAANEWLALEEATLAEQVDDGRAAGRRCHIVILAIGRRPRPKHYVVGGTVTP
jgi:hypothetical protein